MNEPLNQPRSERLRILAHSTLEDLESAWAAWPDPPDYQLLRGPEVGLAMVQARAGGVGGRFNLGEMTITRCSLMTEKGFTGHGYVAGRSPRKAELVALLDALFQEPHRPVDEILDKLQAERRRRNRAEGRKTAATRVNFFTMVRGDE